MAGDTDTVIEGDFGGIGPRQALGAALKESDEMDCVLLISISEGSVTSIFHSEMTKLQMALILAKVQGYCLGVINDWLEAE